MKTIGSKTQKANGAMGEDAKAIVGMEAGY
jgi:hypothetical protein